MNSRRFLSLLVAVAMVLSLAACGGEPTVPTTQPTTAPTTQPTTAPTTQPTTEPTTEPTTAPTEPDPAELYDSAVALLQENTVLLMTVESEKSVTIAGESFVEESKATISYCDYGMDSFQAAVSEVVDLDGYQTSYEERFQDGKIYITVDDTGHFQGTMTAEEYTTRFVPPVMLDAALYSEITLDGDQILFSGAQTGESWIMPEYAELVEASGSAKLSDTNTICGYTYSLTYSVGGIQTRYDFAMNLVIPEAVELAPVDQDLVYVELEYADAPRLMEQATGYLLQSYVDHSVTSTIAESIVSYAGGVIRNQSTTLENWGSGPQYMANLDFSVYMVTAGGEQRYEQEEHFEKGVYTFSSDGSTPKRNLSVKAADFQTYSAEYLVDNMPGWEYLSGAVAEDLGSLYFLELTFTEEQAVSFCGYICDLFWEDPDFLNDLSSDYETTAMDVYLAIDKFTGFPTAVGCYYEGNHTIEGQDYLLSMQVDQSFDLASNSAYESISEEPPVPEEPEEKATPLFYHVTGADGQEMWLLGTIHVGDARTSYLPQEIYDAFDAADALAVEFNSEAFDKEMEENEELSDQVSSCYFYSDGSTAQDHIQDAELFEYAEKLLKATGNYHMNAPYLKVYTWGNSIDNFALRQGRSLSSTQGVDNQLIWRAEDQGKPIYDVESGLFQVQMLTGFSDGLQEMLLLESVATDPLEYISGTQELFEMWCAGDEAALIAYLTEEGDTSELTQEELALLEEYNNAMGTDRNDDMHDVAVGYLESGEVVFYAVGLAHLLAEDGLVNTLRAAGYTVELVPYA